MVALINHLLTYLL